MTIKEKINNIFDNKYTFEGTEEFVPFACVTEAKYQYKNITIIAVDDDNFLSIDSFSINDLEYDTMDNEEYFDIDPYGYNTTLSKEGIHFIEANIE